MPGKKKSSDKIEENPDSSNDYPFYSDSQEIEESIDWRWQDSGEETKELLPQNYSISGEVEIPDEDTQILPAKKKDRLYGNLWYPKGSTAILSGKDYQFVSKNSLWEYLETLEIKSENSRTIAETVKNMVLSVYNYCPIGIAKGYISSGEETFVNIIWFSPEERKYYDYKAKSFVNFMPEQIMML